jgi:5-enolpyruvylshikimate-3-phosphate synthase
LDNKPERFVSALLMNAPLAKNEVEVRVTGEMVSESFIEMTIGLMKR